MSKPFLIHCLKCSWKILTNGTSGEIKELNLHEIKNNCPTCGKTREFRCMRCGGNAKMIRIKGNK